MSTKKSIIIGIFIVVAGGVILDKVLKLPILGSIIGSISAVGTFLFSDHSFSLPGWALFIVGSLTLLGLIISVFIVWDIFFPKYPNEQKPQREDSIYGVKWRWTQYGNEISSLRCFCPNCDLELSPSQYEELTLFDCERCRFRKEHIIRDYLEHAVEKEIERRIRAQTSDG